MFSTPRKSAIRLYLIQNPRYHTVLVKLFGKGQPHCVFCTVLVRYVEKNVKVRIIRFASAFLPKVKSFAPVDLSGRLFAAHTHSHHHAPPFSPLSLPLSLSLTNIFPSLTIFLYISPSISSASIFHSSNSLPFPHFPVPFCNPIAFPMTKY